MQKYRFNYDVTFKALPKYTDHSGAVVTVTSVVSRELYEFNGDELVVIQADDGWTGYAFRSELEAVTD